MAVLVNIIVAIASAIFWFVQKFLPFLIKKYGIGAVKFAIQKVVTGFLILTTVAFYASVIVFISNTFTVFRNFLDLLNNPAASSFGGNGASYIPCILYLLNVSGISAGFNAAFSFGLSVVVFMFLHKLYQISVRVLKIVSDELNKSLRLV